jgi:transcriptional regulator with XRE-family HTH domain
MTTEARLGPALRELRRRFDWTLNDVSLRTGLSVSTLSKAERNQLSLTYDKLVQLSEGLGVDITTFFEDETHHASSGGGAGRRSVNRRDDGQVIDTPNYQYVYLCTDLLKKKFVPIVAEIRARSIEEFGELVRHAGEEFAYVLEGSVAVHTEHYAPVILREGESIYFESGMAHAYIAQGKATCRVLSICSAPELSLKEAMNQHFGLAGVQASLPVTATASPSRPRRVSAKAHSRGRS